MEFKLKPGFFYKHVLNYREFEPSPFVVFVCHNDLIQKYLNDDQTILVDWLGVHAMGDPLFDF